MIGRKHPEDASTPEPPIDRAERMATSHKAAAWKLIRLVRGPIEDLFGHTVAEALLPVIEVVTENADEAIYHFREAVDEERDRATKALEVAGWHREQHGEALDLLRAALADDDQRQKRRKGDPPEWTTRARSITRTAATEIEPF